MTGYLKPRAAREKTPEALAQDEVHRDRVHRQRCLEAAAMLQKELKAGSGVSEPLLAAIVILLRRESKAGADEVLSNPA